MNATESNLLPRAKLKDVLGGRARFVGSRMDAGKPRGFFSPVEARLRMGIPYDDLRVAEADYLGRRSFKADLGVMARTALAYALSPASKKPAAARPFIVSAHVDNLTIDQALELVLAPPQTSRGKLVYFVHAHSLNLARFNRDYAGILAEADALLPDGIGIRLAARTLGVSMRHNVNGTDLFPLLCREAAREGIPVALVGGAPGIAAECARRMQAENPTLQLPVVYSGYFANDTEAQAVADRIAALGRVIVLIGMGSPRQERWSWRFLRHTSGATVLTVGGLFDFYSGRIRRAPIIWREMGIEWLWRLLQEPRRLAKRYLIGNPLFMLLALEQKLFRRKA